MDLARTIADRIPGLLARVTPYGLHGALSRALHGCGSVLDIGCGTRSMLHHFCRGRFVVGLDRFVPSLQANRAAGTYSGHVNGDLLEWPLGRNSVDAVVALDVIEHFERAEGWRVLELMEQTARKRVIVLTPNGFVPQEANDNPWQVHKSGWTVEDFHSREYGVEGVYGWKSLRGEHSRLTRSPRLFWELVSCFSQPLVRRNPQHAYTLCAVRRFEA